MRFEVAAFAILLLLSRPSQARAEWQIKTFAGVAWGETTFVDLEHAAGKPHQSIGVNGGLIGDVFGIEGDIGLGPGFLQSGNQNLVLRSSVTTVTGNVTLALPRSVTEYTLRPYVVGGAGLMHVKINDNLRVLPLSRSLAAMDLGAGVTGFLTNRVGLNWDIRRFRSIQGKDQGFSFGPEKLSFWRANMALAFRY